MSWISDGLPQNLWAILADVHREVARWYAPDVAERELSETERMFGVLFAVWIITQALAIKTTFGRKAVRIGCQTT